VTVAVNCALPCPLSTVTDAGTLTFALPSDIATNTLPAAVPASVTVQVALPAALNIFGAQLRPDNPAGAARLTDAVRLTPFIDAETVTVWLTPIAPAVIVKDAALEPSATVTLPGVVNCALSSDSVTVEVPLEGLSRFTVQVAL
jgi:hypothetical protein